jgi:hypothetical protein
VLTYSRLNRLERALDRLLERIGDEPTRDSSRSNTPLRPLSRTQSILQANDASEAPVMIIRDLAAEAGAQSPDISRVSTQGIFSDDVITGGLLSFTDAVSLLAMYVPFAEINHVLEDEHRKSSGGFNLHHQRAFDHSRAVAIHKFATLVPSTTSFTLFHCLSTQYASFSSMTMIKIS